MPDDTVSPTTRGSLQFQVTSDGDLLNSAVNVNLLRQLWTGRNLIQKDDLGPGDPGDFDHGAWHSSCHLLGAGGACRLKDGRLLWLEVSHAHTRDEYTATITVREKNSVKTILLDSAEGRNLVDDSTGIGFIEGNSTGRTSARGVFDSPTKFNLWRRQDFDQPLTSTVEGGKVWEHWCTLRDLRPACDVATTVMSAYISLVAALGDKFAPMVLRGRRDYGHPKQLCAMVKAGFIAEISATTELTPTAIPAAMESHFLEGNPEHAFAAVEKLDWSNPLRYYMFARKIASWSTAKNVEEDLKQFTLPK